MRTSFLSPRPVVRSARAIAIFGAIVLIAASRVAGQNLDVEANNTPYTLTSSASYDEVTVGYNSNATLNQDAVTLTIGNYIQLGGGISSFSHVPYTGIYNLYSGGMLSVAGDEDIFSGSFTQSGGSNTTGALYLGDVYSGSYALNGGTLSAGVEYLGENGGSGSFTQSNGINTTSSLEMGGSNSGGTYNLDGSTLAVSSSISGSGGSSAFNFNGGTLQAGGGNSIYVRYLTTLQVRNGGAIIDTNGGSVSIEQALVHSTISGDSATDGGLTKNGAGTLYLEDGGTYTGATNINAGVLNLLGGASLTNTGTMYVNAGGELDIFGSVNLGGNILEIGNGGTAAATGYLYTYGSLSAFRERVGDYSAGSFVQSGGANTISGFLGIGGPDGGSGAYTLFAGTLSAAGEYIGNGGDGVFDQTGGTNTVGSAVGFIFGDGSGHGTGTYNLSAGTLQIAGVIMEGASATFNFNGGKLQATAASSTFMQGLTTANVQKGGAVIDSNGNNITIAQPLLHDTTAGAPAADGGLTKLGSGTLTLSGLNTYNGTTTVSAGKLEIASNGALAEGNVSIASGAYLELDLGVNAAHNLDTGTTLTLATANTSIVDLAGLGVQDTVAALVVNGTTEPIGTYGAAGSGALYTNIADFTGTGELLVTGAVPEPSAWLMVSGALGLGVIVIMRRRLAVRVQDFRV